MAQRGDWINFEELCRRWPAKKPRTLRRYIAERLISYRQVKRGCPLEFNWHTVERELQVLETPGVNFEQANRIPQTDSDQSMVREQIALLSTKLDHLIALMSTERKAS